MTSDEAEKACADVRKTADDCTSDDCKKDRTRIEDDNVEAAAKKCSKKYPYMPNQCCDMYSCVVDELDFESDEY